jgi:hypothetical protein
MTKALPCDDIKKKILIIDYECLTAHEGKHGLQLAREWRCNPIITFIMLDVTRDLVCVEETGL